MTYSRKLILLVILGLPLFVCLYKSNILPKIADLKNDNVATQNHQLLFTEAKENNSSKETKIKTNENDGGMKISKSAILQDTVKPKKIIKPFKEIDRDFKYYLGPTSDSYIALSLPLPNDKLLNNNITIVSAYFRLPPFRKGFETHPRKPSFYENLMRAFSYIINPLVIYTDDNKVHTILTTLFNKVNKTSFKVIKIQRNMLWSFQQMPIISEILKQKNYPVHYPNTVIPAYNCLSHAKFEVVKRAIKENWFNTKYYFWLDIGYFRNPIDGKFGLDLPKKFDEQRVSVTVVGNLHPNISLETIVRSNMNWIAAGSILGRYDILNKFCSEYLHFLLGAIKQKMVGVDQQILFAMYTSKNKPQTSLQLCEGGWFCLGELAVQIWWQKLNSNNR